jgi:hypothetical protein
LGRRAFVATVKAVVQGSGRIARTTGRLLRSPDRLENIKSLARWWTFRDESQAIPEQFIGDLFPGIEQVCTPLPLAMENNFELPYGEKAILDGLVHLLEPRTLFEFGTATGTTTVLLADAAPEGAVVHTVDLPEDADPEIGLGAVGSAFNGRPEYRDRIVQHRVDLRSFDVEPFRKAVDFVFVDAGHDYDSVRHDSAVAFEMLRPGGCIVWDDYQPIHWGTVRALNEVGRDHKLSRFAYSRFVVYTDPDARAV